jgi:O-antigen/teichoic acid export membrane protein
MTNERSFMNSLKWAYTANWGQKGLSSVFLIILAGILGPSEFGMVAIATVYISFLNMFLDQGLMAALIQRKDLRDEHLDAVFWMDQVLAIALVGVSILLSGWWAARNHAPAAANLISALSLDIPLMALVNVQTAILNRRMDFKSLSICANVSALVGGIVGVGMAVAGFRAWSLVGQQLAKDSTSAIFLWRSSHWHPRFEFSWQHLRELMRFSISNFIAQLGIFADLQASSVILGLFFGPVALGLYRFADRIMWSVINVTMSAIQSVSFPEFSRLQHQPEELRKSVLTCIRMTSAITLPALCGLAAVSTPLMATIGAQWIPASPVLKLLCMLGVAIVFAYFTGPLLQALSRPRELAILEWTRMAIGTAVLVCAGSIVRNGSISSQILGIAMARFVTGAVLVTPVFVFILLRLCGISFREFIFVVAPSAISAASVVISTFLFSLSGWLQAGRPIILLTAEIAVGAVVGIVVLLGLEAQLRRSVAALFWPDSLSLGAG